MRGSIIERSREAFGKRLYEELKKFGFELEGYYPFLKTSIYTIEVNFDKNTATIWYGPRQERLKICELFPENIARELNELHSFITKREFEDKIFLSRVFEAYESLAKVENRKVGDPLPIVKVLLRYIELSQNFQEKSSVRNFARYGRVLFSYDLFRLRERKFKNYELELVTATRAYTRRKMDYLWIPADEKGNGVCVSHLRFRKTDEH